MQLFKNNKCVKVFKASKPKFGGKKCTWMDETILIDEKKINVYWECMRGERIRKSYLLLTFVCVYCEM